MEPRRGPTLAEISYRKQLDTLVQSGIPFLVGGAYALDAYAGIFRDTKDFDLFVLPDDMPRVLDLFAAAGYRTQVASPHWLAKVFSQDAVVDVIFSSGNGLGVVDAEWFAHARPFRLFDLELLLCPPEETLWQKSFIMERNRYDGADVAHLLRSCVSTLDWQRLLKRFGAHWPVLLNHLVLFGYIYPNEWSLIPAWVMEQLWDQVRTASTAPATAPSLCRGTLLSSRQYKIDIENWGYLDARLAPAGPMMPEQVAQWEAWLESESVR